MKIDLTSLYFNGDTESVGNTASWGTALGQERPDYPISVEGGIELLNLIKEHHIDFDPHSNQDQYANIKNLNDKKIVESGRFDKVYVNKKEFNYPFFIIVVQETTGSHIGRKILKYNNKIRIGNDSNDIFYQAVQSHFGDTSCWFVYDISAINGELHMTAVKVDDKPVKYKNAEERKGHWGSLINNFDAIKQIFKKYLIEVHKLKHETSANEYIKAMSKIEKWFIDNQLCKSDYKIWNVINDNSSINHLLKNDFKLKWDKLNKTERGWYGTPWNRWLEFIEWYNRKSNRSNTSLDASLFSNQCSVAGLVFSDQIICRLIASLCSKPFVILTGLSGSGKTKLAQAFVQWICQDESQYLVIPVGADWTNREPLLGYPNALKPDEYVKPDSGVLELIINSNNHPEMPHFLILDEMNLSHVERYFADFLSVMESKEEIPLYAEGKVQNGVPAKLKVPSNLFIIGTVNIDETTNMFSPKVLDRANTIEFHVTKIEMEKFLGNI